MRAQSRSKVSVGPGVLPTVVLAVLTVAACNDVLGIETPTMPAPEAEAGARCPAEHPLHCHDRCVDPTTDEAHCGGCDSPCTGSADQVVACVPEGGGRCLHCDPGQVVCGTACVDLGTSAENCGACGHSCRGAACADGRCAPVPVATGLNTVLKLLVDGEYLYYVAFVSEVGSIFARAPRQGEACEGATPRCRLTWPAALVKDEPPNALEAGAFAGNSHSVYVVAAAKTLLRLVKGGETWEHIGSTGRAMTALAATESSVFAGVYGADFLVKQNAAPGGVGAVVGRSAQGTVGVGSLLASGADVYAPVVESDGSTSLGLHKFVTSSALTCIDDSCLVQRGHLRGLTSAGNWIYFALSSKPDSPDVQIVRMHPDGRCDDDTPCPSPRIGGIALSLPTVPMVADDRHVYFVTRSLVSGLAVRRQPVEEPCEGTAAKPCGELMIEGFQNIPALALDATHLYLAAVPGSGTSSILKVAK